MTTIQIKIKPAPSGTVCGRTLRTVDLLPAFATEIEWQLSRNGEYFSRPENFTERDRLNNLVGDAQDCFGEDGETLTEEGEANGPEVINEMIDALCLFAPAYGYFGANNGDGSDFGYWCDVEGVKEQVEFISSEEQEYPDAGFVGEWLHVNERGNCTLYVRDSGDVDRELWSIV